MSILALQQQKTEKKRKPQHQCSLFRRFWSMLVQQRDCVFHLQLRIKLDNKQSSQPDNIVPHVFSPLLFAPPHTNFFPLLIFLTASFLSSWQNERRLCGLAQETKQQPTSFSVTWSHWILHGLSILLFQDLWSVSKRASSFSRFLFFFFCFFSLPGSWSDIGLARSRTARPTADSSW